MKERGFTLIELTIVLAILVIVSGFSITRLPGWSSRQALRSSARVLGNTIRTWRERARADETPYSLEFSGVAIKCSLEMKSFVKAAWGRARNLNPTSRDPLSFEPGGFCQRHR